MSQWIKDAIENATRDRRTNREYALLRESTYRRLFPQLEQVVRQQIRADVAEYNAHFQNAPAKQLKLNMLSNTDGLPLTYDKVGDPPTGSVSISFDRDGRSIHASFVHTDIDSDGQVRTLQWYRLRLDGETIIMEDEAGGLVAVTDVSRRILEPFFQGVT